MEEYTREPCPWRIVDDCGGAFTMGLVGGGVFQTFKGFRNAPSGISKRLVCTFYKINNSLIYLMIFNYLFLPQFLHTYYLLGCCVLNILIIRSN